MYTKSFRTLNNLSVMKETFVSVAEQFYCIKYYCFPVFKKCVVMNKRILITRLVLLIFLYNVYCTKWSLLSTTTCSFRHESVYLSCENSRWHISSRAFIYDKNMEHHEQKMTVTITMWYVYMWLYLKRSLTILTKP